VHEFSLSHLIAFSAPSIAPAGLGGSSSSFFFGSFGDRLGRALRRLDAELDVLERAAVAHVDHAALDGDEHGAGRRSVAGPVRAGAAGLLVAQGGPRELRVARLHGRDQAQRQGARHLAGLGAAGDRLGLAGDGVDGDAAAGGVGRATSTLAQVGQNRLWDEDRLPMSLVRSAAAAAAAPDGRAGAAERVGERLVLVVVLVALAVGVGVALPLGPCRRSRLVDVRAADVGRDHRGGEGRGDAEAEPLDDPEVLFEEGFHRGPSPRAVVSGGSRRRSRERRGGRGAAGGSGLALPASSLR
jgi:hypothetical protein